MFSKLFLFVAIALALALKAEAFAPVSTMKPSFSTSLFASRTNAKKEKRKRNRENMRKFSSPGKRGTSKKKTLKKVKSNAARQVENEFIAKCFITGPAPNADVE